MKINIAYQIQCWLAFFLLIYDGERLLGSERGQTPCYILHNFLTHNSIKTRYPRFSKIVMEGGCVYGRTTP